MTGWREHALCKEMDPEIFYPPQGQNEAYLKAFCSRCPVQEQCLEFALKMNDPWGIWGGLTSIERARIAAHRKKR